MAILYEYKKTIYCMVFIVEKSNRMTLKFYLPKK